MKKKELSSFKQFTRVDAGDLLFGKSLSGGEYGFFPASLLGNDGYAAVRFNLDQSSPAGERCGNLEYVRQLPSLLGLGCYLVGDDHSRKKLDPNNHYKLATGETAKLDGTMGQYMWGVRTPFYVAVWVEGSYLYEAASLKPIPGRECYRVPVFSVGAGHSGVIDRTNSILCSLVSSAEQYRGGGGSALTSGNGSADNLSMLGYAATQKGTAAFEELGRKRGEGWGAGWYWIDTVIMILADIILGTRNIQASFNASKDSDGLYQGGLGPGVSAMPSWGDYNSYYPVVPYSAGVELGDALGVGSFPVKNSSGAVVYNAPIPCFFGLKNPYGHLWCGKNRIVAVLNSDYSNTFYVAKSSLTEWVYSDTANMLKVGTTAPSTPGSWNYVKRVNFQGLAGMPSEDGATSSTYRSDGCYFHKATSGFRSPLGSGNANNGGNDGLAYFNGNYAPSNSNANLSSPHYLGRERCLLSRSTWGRTPALAERHHIKTGSGRFARIRRRL